MDHPLTAPAPALVPGPRHLLVVNPKAGKHRTEQLVRALAGAFAARRAAFDLVETEGPGHATHLARAAVGAGYGAVVAVGGDGTIAEVVAGVAGSAVPVGIVPRGTGNQLACNLGIPYAAEAAAEVVVQGFSEAMDLGRLVDGRLFAVAAGAGWDAAVMHATTRDMKERWGYAAYLISAMRHGINPPASLFRITANGETVEVPAAMVLVANMGQIAARLRRLVFQVAPGADHRDGKLDVVIFAPRHLPDVARLLWGMASRRYPGDDRLLFIQCESVTVAADPDVYTEVDGEPLGRTPLEVGIVRDAVRVIVPPIPGARGERHESRGGERPMTRASILALFLAACATAPARGVVSPEDATWTLARLAGEPARAAGAEAPTLRLDSATGRASGNTGCNGFSGPYELRGDSILFGTLVSTRRACVDEGMNRQEAAYLGMLSEARTWRLAGDTLLIEGGRGAARFLPGR